MKFECNPANLKAAIQRLANLPGSRVIGGVYIVADEFTGLRLKRQTDLSTMWVECDATVMEPGTAIVAYEALLARAAAWKGEELTFTEKAGKLQLHNGTKETELALWLDENFPDLQPIVANAFTFPAQTFMDWMAVAERAAYKTGERGNIRGVNIRTFDGRVVICGMDGRRIHACFGEETFETIGTSRGRDGEVLAYDPGVLLPKELTGCIGRLVGDDEVPVKVRMSERGGQVEAAGRTFRFLTTTEVAPDLTPYLVSQKADRAVTLQRQALLDLVKAAAPLGWGTSNSIEVRFDNDRAWVITDDRSGNTDKDHCPCMAKTPFSIFINASFFLDYLTSLRGGEVEIGYLQTYNAIFSREPDRFLLIVCLHKT